MQTGTKSDPIDAKYWVTGVISGAIGVTRDTEPKKRGKGKKGKGEEGEGEEKEIPFPCFPFPLTCS